MWDGHKITAGWMDLLNQSESTGAQYFWWADKVLHDWAMETERDYSCSDVLRLAEIMQRDFDHSCKNKIYQQRTEAIRTSDDDYA